ncbi:hypothetical protein [Mucilaginibacter sp.]|uniref:hypothetical protein n=1 Tax=Mucilaginibacter sp. TaxID=1882438 RepID=UPI0025FFF07A|nr:hypothetical protein [Mucilaginibacter sp.]
MTGTNKTMSVFILCIWLCACSMQKRVKYHDDSVVFYRNLFKLSSDDRFKGKDSIVTIHFTDGKIKAIGRFAIDTKGELSNLKTGKWIEYYENGHVESKGYYKIGKFINCGPGGLEQEYYNYKYGDWGYYFADGSAKAFGRYVISKYPIKTTCGESTLINFGLTDDKWMHHTTFKSLEEFEVVTTKDEFYTDILFYDRAKGRMVMSGHPNEK